MLTHNLRFAAGNTRSSVYEPSPPPETVNVRSSRAQTFSECAGYTPIAQEHLYTVLHQTEDPRARILLVGPFASERHFSHAPWVRWARFLATRGIEAVRFDYRGVGESTGDFAKMGFGDWIADTELLAGWLQRRAPNVPVILHGFELGGLLASRLFVKGIGDALLTWDAPETANQILQGVLSRHVAADNMFKYGAERRLFGDYLQELESSSLEVDGYQWSARLWHESFNIKIPAIPAPTSERPVRFVHLETKAASRFGTVINPDLTDVFIDNCEWLFTSLSLRDKGRP